MNPVEKFQFNRYGVLTDGEIEVALSRTNPADPVKGLVPSYEFDIRLPGIAAPIGRVALRIGDTRLIMMYAGHIGYGINEDYRGHHYAAKACHLIRQVALDHDLTTLWITCNPDNIASRRTCEMLGCDFVEIVDLPEDTDMYREGERQKCRYRWDLLKQPLPQNWDAIYRRGWPVLPPHEYLPKVIELFKARRVDRVLDLGCGAGRHLVHLAEQGFRVCGMDSSPAAISQARESLAHNRLTVDLRVASMFDRFPYADDFFDAIVCVKVLNHGRIEDIRVTIRELERVLKPGGLVFLVVTKTRKILPSQKQTAQIIAERTLIPATGRETGVIHYQFNKAILLRELRHFRVIDFQVDATRNYCLTGELRNNPGASFSGKHTSMSDT